LKKFIVKLVGKYLNTVSYFSANYAAKKALYLFSKPNKGKLSPKHIDFLQSAKQHSLQYKNLNIATYHWKGSKTTILLAHGWESNSARWKNTIKHLIEENFNIIALDAPAHGASGSNVFNALLYAEFINIVAKKHKPEVIIGHSVGGMATVFFQQKYSLDSLKKLILLGAPSEFSNILKNYIKLLGYNKRLEKQLHRFILKKFGFKPSEFSTAKFSKHINAKSLIIHDIKDRIIPFSDAKLINKNLCA